MLARLALAASLAASALALPAPQAGSAPAASSASGSLTGSSTTSASSSAASSSASSGSASATSSSAAAASPSSSASAYLTGLIAAIQARNAPLLASVLQNNTAIAQAVGGAFASGQPYTLLAPSDPGLSAALAQIDTSNTTLVEMVLGYHVLPGSYPADSLGVNKTTIINSVVNENVVLFRDQYLTTHVAGGQNATVLANSTYQNVLIKLIDNALHLPVNVSSTWQMQQPDSQLLTTIASALPNFVTALDTGSLTVFAPSNAAIANHQAAVMSLAANTTALQTVLEGHVVNGTVLYSNAGPNNLALNGTTQSAAGTQLQFLTNSTGAYVVSQGTTAKVITSDIIVSNGVGQPAVIHLIDNVLIPPSNATSAAAGSPASSAPASSSAAAAPSSSASA